MKGFWREVDLLNVRLIQGLSIVSPLVNSCPNTAGCSPVEQFHLSVLNWLWHSVTASRAPSWMLGSRNGFFRHKSRCLWLSGREEQPNFSGTPAEVRPSQLRDTADRCSANSDTEPRLKSSLFKILPVEQRLYIGINNKSDKYEAQELNSKIRLV